MRTTSPLFNTFLPLTPILKKSLTRLWQHRFCLPVGWRCGSWFLYTFLRVPKKHLSLKWKNKKNIGWLICTLENHTLQVTHHVSKTRSFREYRLYLIANSVDGCYHAAYHLALPGILPTLQKISKKSFNKNEPGFHSNPWLWQLLYWLSFNPKLSPLVPIDSSDFLQKNHYSFPRKPISAEVTHLISVGIWPTEIFVTLGQWTLRGQKKHIFC